MTAPVLPTFAALPEASPIAAVLSEVVRSASARAPRSRQRAVGPSEIGTPCARRLAYRALDVDPVEGGGGDPWASIVGTAVHAWLASAFEADNRRRTSPRWLVEQRVRVSESITGTVDLYDGETATVVDHKVLGAASMKRVKAEGAGEPYRSQAHLYGLGLARAGLPVERVALAVYPRSGFLSDLYVWSEPYSEARALAALDRLAAVITVAGVLDVDTHPERWALIPADSGACAFCPYLRPGLASACADGCPGT